MDEQKSYLEDLADQILSLYLKDNKFFLNFKDILKEEHFSPFNDVFYPLIFKIRGALGDTNSGTLKLEVKKALERQYSSKDPEKRAEIVNLNYQTCVSIIDRLLSIEADATYIGEKVPELIKEIETTKLLKEMFEKRKREGEYRISDHTDKLREIAEFRISGVDEEKKNDYIRNKCIESFPHNAIQGFIQRVSDLYAGILESPYPFWVFNTAVCLGNVMSSRIRLKTSLFPYPTMYVVCLGSSGETRKSESGKQITRLFTGWDIFKQECERKNQEAIVGAAGMADFKPSTALKIVFGIGSAEGLMETLKSVPNCVIFFDELRAFAQKCQVQGSNLLQIVNTLFENTFYENVVKKNVQSISNVRLSIIGCSTIETWNSMFTASFINIGFINRLWLVPGEGKKKDFLPPEIPRHKITALYARLTSIFEFFPNGSVMEVDSEALDLLQEWYESCEASDFTKRLETYGLRILMLMALSEKKRSINEDMAKRCIQLLEWQKEVRESYQPVEYTSVVAQIENLIRKAVMIHSGISKSQLLSRIGAKRFETWKVDKAIETLIKSKEIRGVPGRGTTRYEIMER